MMTDQVERLWRIELKQADGSWIIWQHPNAKVPSRFETFEGALSQAGRKKVQAGKARIGKDASPSES
jgi:hypothetical protein